jgi:hypothetical protein
VKIIQLMVFGLTVATIGSLLSFSSNAVAAKPSTGNRRAGVGQAEEKKDSLDFPEEFEREPGQRGLFTLPPAKDKILDGGDEAKVFELKWNPARGGGDVTAGTAIFIFGDGEITLDWMDLEPGFRGKGLCKPFLGQVLKEAKNMLPVTGQDHTVGLVMQADGTGACRCYVDTAKALGYDVHAAMEGLDAGDRETEESQELQDIKSLLDSDRPDFDSSYKAFCEWHMGRRATREVRVHMVFEPHSLPSGAGVAAVSQLEEALVPALMSLHPLTIVGAGSSSQSPESVPSRKRKAPSSPEGNSERETNRSRNHEPVVQTP